MRAFALLFLGCVVGWTASGEWSVEATGEESIIDDAQAVGTTGLTLQPTVPDASEVPAAPVIEPMVEISSSRDVRKVIVSDEAATVDLYRAMTRVQIEELGGRERVDGIVGAHDLKFLTAGLNGLAAEGWSLVTIEQAHQYKITGPAGASITNPATYIFERRH